MVPKESSENSLQKICARSGTIRLEASKISGLKSAHSSLLNGHKSIKTLTVLNAR